MERLSFDTTFLIDLQRERRKNDVQGSAHVFLEEHSEHSFEISSVVLGEYAEGFTHPRNEGIEELLRFCEVWPIDTEVALVYGEIVRTLRIRGELIGANDLWIAATSIRHKLSLVTRNTAHFKRVSGLRLVEY